MNFKNGSIGNIHGLGCATIKVNHRGVKYCDGILNTENESEAAKLHNSEGVSFSGTVYDGEKESTLTFPIIITKIQGNSLSFSALGNPYAKLS